MAFLISEQLNLEVEIIESRDHIGGNAFSYLDEQSGIEIHKYGSHLFHTSNERVWQFINQFSTFNSYRHTVWANHKNKIYSLPINLATINTFLNNDFSPEQARAWLQMQTKPIGRDNLSNLESKAISLIGNQLYDAFFKGYTKKQWQTDPKDLPADVITRLPVRLNYVNNYFNDTYEGLPTKGYFGIFGEMISNRKIKVATNTNFFDRRSMYMNRKLVIYTGPLDRFFEYKFGELGWRTLDFQLEHHDLHDYQGCSVMNYSDESIPYTRIHEFKHLHPERTDVYKSNKTVIAREYSRMASKSDEPYYPINTSLDRASLRSYRNLAVGQSNVLFGGRLGTYKYLDMHMAIASAISDFSSFVKERLS
jgi:UDP-galactopyranose mutase